MTVWKQQRPDWCPHQDCAYRASSQGCLCVGELPAPTPHAGDFNTHRLCIAQSCPGDDEWLFKLEIHSGDANGMARVLGRVFGFKPVALEAHQPSREGELEAALEAARPCVVAFVEEHGGKRYRQLIRKIDALLLKLESGR